MGYELLEPQEMARADSYAVQMGIASTSLMDKAGTAVADVVSRRPLTTRVLVLCGPGNNGGDGFVAARILAQRGYRVRLALLGEVDQLRGDAAVMAGKWRGAVEEPAALDLSACDLIVDALYGAGLARDLDGAAKVLVERMAASGRPVIAVDLPSGLDGRTGQVRGAVAPAAETVTFFRRKPGHLLEPGRNLCGKVRLADIGIPEEAIAAVGPTAFVDMPGLWERAFPMPRAGGHKYDRGHAVVVSGEAWTSGAARLAARGALRAGAGLVTLACPASVLPLQAGSYAAIMAREAQDARALDFLLRDPRLATVLLGPGLGVGEETRRRINVAAPGRRLVLDADALTSFAGDAPGLATSAGGASAWVVTPHEGEFARLFAGDTEVIGGISKLERTRAAARRLGAVVVLKGPDTVIAEPGGRAAIAENAPAFLATAGAGDVLAGFVTGLLAQGMPAFEAASCAVWLHGEAAREAGPGLVADDLPEALQPVYGRLFTSLG